MTGGSIITTDHKKIKKWTEERGGKPAVVKNTAKSGKGAGVLRVNFPQYSTDSSLQEITWEEFFSIFDEKKLAFLYQEKTADGKESRFFKFVSRK